jgi:hypothetical protein
VPFLMKDLVLLAVSIYLLKQDFIRVFQSSRNDETVPIRPRVDRMTAAV